MNTSNYKSTKNNNNTAPGINSDRSTTSSVAKGLFDVMAEGISRAMSRSSISSIDSVTIANNLSSR